MALYAAYTPDTVDTVYTVDVIYTVDMLFILFKLLFTA